jgi:hypothetical protein
MVVLKGGLQRTQESPRCAAGTAVITMERGTSPRGHRALSLAPQLSKLISENQYCALIFTMLQCGFILTFNPNVATGHVNTQHNARECNFTVNSKRPCWQLIIKLLIGL